MYQQLSAQCIPLHLANLLLASCGEGGGQCLQPGQPTELQALSTSRVGIGKGVNDDLLLLLGQFCGLPARCRVVRVVLMSGFPSRL